MKTNPTLDELITPNVLELSARFLSFENTNFNAHVQLLSLDPTADFRFADLSGVDFTNSDVRGYDFTGADLQGATGVNVRWDKTTILDQANIGDSLFSYRLARDRFLADNPAIARQVTRLKNDYWCNTILGVEKLLRDKKNRHGIRIARAVFDETSDTVVRSNVLLFMRLTVDSGEEHRQFIYNIFASHAEQTNVIVAGIRALNALYSDQKANLNIFMAYLNHKDALVELRDRRDLRGRWRAR